MASPFSRVVFNAREELLTSDLNRTESLISRDLQDYIRDSGRGVAAPGSSGLIFGDLNNIGGVIDGTCLPPTLASSGTFDVVVGAGQGFLNDVGITGSDSSFQVLRWPQQTLTFTTPDATNPRFDLIIAAPGTQSTDLEARNILLDPVARTVGQQSVPTTQNPLSVLSIVTGTPGATPSPPAVPFGSVALFEVLVGAAALSSVSFRPVRRMWQRAEYPLCSSYGILSGCELVVGGTPDNETTTDASAPNLSLNLYNRAIIDGEILTWGPNLLNGGASIDSLANPFSAAAPSTQDRPYYIYLCGGKNLPQFTTGSPAAPVCLVESLTPPSGFGYPTAAINTPRGQTQRGALFVGVGFTTNSSTKRKAVFFEGDWVRPKTGALGLTTTTTGADVAREAAFNDLTSITLATNATSVCNIHTKPALSTSMEVVVQFSNVADTLIVGILGSGTGTTVYGGAQLITSSAAPMAIGRFRAPTNATIGASGTADAGTATLRVCASAYNMGVLRYNA